MKLFPKRVVSKSNVIKEKPEMKLTKIVPLTLLLALASGCTSKQLYNAAQQNRLQNCSELQGAQRDECEALYQKDYQTYERERQEVLNDKN
ncbi:MAG: hypothetical protein SVW51_11710 [Pseudomonadota bacterium]|nr:hypothetical protein [Pseudomonadota bacterium]